jgi:hypothetical protein
MEPFAPGTNKLDLCSDLDTEEPRMRYSATWMPAETFLPEMESGFSFVARQKRIQLDGEDFYIDLLFYNRKLKRLIVVELKQGIPPENASHPRPSYPDRYLQHGALAYRLCRGRSLDPLAPNRALAVRRGLHFYGCS